MVASARLLPATFYIDRSSTVRERVFGIVSFEEVVTGLAISVKTPAVASIGIQKQAQHLGGLSLSL